MKDAKTYEYTNTLVKEIAEVFTRLRPETNDGLTALSSVLVSLAYGNGWPLEDLQRLVKGVWDEVAVVAATVEQKSKGVLQ